MHAHTRHSTYYYLIFSRCCVISGDVKNNQNTVTSGYTMQIAISWQRVSEVFATLTVSAFEILFLGAEGGYGTNKVMTNIR